MKTVLWDQGRFFLMIKKRRNKQERRRVTPEMGLTGLALVESIESEVDELFKAAIVILDSRIVKKSSGHQGPYTNPAPAHSILR